MDSCANRKRVFSFVYSLTAVSFHVIILVIVVVLNNDDEDDNDSMH